MKLTYSSLLLLLITTGVNAQVLTKTDVLAMKAQNSGALMQGDQVKGYYFFYDQEKKNQNINRFLLVLTDENLVEINSIPIIRPNSFRLLNGTFNGDSFAFVGYDENTKTGEFLTFNRDLKQTASVLKVVEGLHELAGETSYNNNKYLIPVNNLGFLRYGDKQGSSKQFEIGFYNNEMKRIWTDPSPEMKRVEFTIEAFQDSSYIGTIIGKRRGSKNVDYDLLVQETLTGKHLFRTALETPNYTLAVSNVYFDKANFQFIVFGEYYGLDDREMKDQSFGFATLIYNASGKLISEKLNSWTKEISNATPLNEQGKFEGSNARVFFHTALRTNDGQIFLIGEQYKKVASETGIAANALSFIGAALTGIYVSGAATSQINVYNLVIFQFNPDFTINKVHIFEKAKTAVLLPPGSTYSSAKVLSDYIKRVGGFDYAFSQQSVDGATFIVHYTNRIMSAGTPKYVLGSIIYTPEKNFAKDEILLTRKSSEYHIFKAKEGYIVLSEYFRKEKRLESRLEKINY